MISNLKAVVTGEVNEAFYLIKNGKYVSIIFMIWSDMAILILMMI